jgi:hypothetical protein
MVRCSPSTERRACVCFTINHDPTAAAAEFGKTRKEILAHKCVNTWS